MCLSTITSFLPIVNTSIILTGGILALIQYNKQQRFKRINNLVSIWQKFINSDENMELFDLCDQIESSGVNDENLNNQLVNFDRRIKLKFLGLLEEVAIFTEKFEVEKKYANYLFQWHFKY